MDDSYLHAGLVIARRQLTAHGGGGGHAVNKTDDTGRSPRRRKQRRTAARPLILIYQRQCPVAQTVTYDRKLPADLTDGRLSIRLERQRERGLVIRLAVQRHVTARCPLSPAPPPTTPTSSSSAKKRKLAASSMSSSSNCSVVLELRSRPAARA